MKTLLTIILVSAILTAVVVLLLTGLCAAISVSSLNDILSSKQLHVFIVFLFFAFSIANTNYIYNHD